MTEAAHRHAYVAAHAYSSASIELAVAAGVHSIEHGNLLDRSAAEAMAASGAVLVPTLVTYQAMAEVGAKLGLPATNVAKNSVVYDAGLASLEIARDAGVVMGFGTDLIGETQSRQNAELTLRSEVLEPSQILRSMWVVNAALCQLEGRVGTITPGAFGDVLVSRVDPLTDLAGFADHEQAITHVVQGGRVVVERDL